MKSPILVFILFISTFALAQNADRPSKELFEECFNKAGIARPTQGERPTPPTDEQRQVVDSCLRDKGFNPPAKGERRGHRPPPLNHHHQSQSTSEGDAQ